jgi:hypothetical protein
MTISRGTNAAEEETTGLSKRQPIKKRLSGIQRFCSIDKG